MDFTKTFDYVNRGALYYKLIKNGGTRQTVFFVFWFFYITGFAFFTRGCCLLRK